MSDPDDQELLSLGHNEYITNDYIGDNIHKYMKSGNIENDI